MRKLTPILLAAFLLFGAAACSDDDDGGEASGGDRSSEEQEFIDAAMAEFDAEEAAPLEEEDARCIVESMVDRLGVDRLEEAGLTADSFGDDSADPFPEDLSEEEANDVVDGLQGCIDMSQLFLEGMADDPTISDEAKECLAGAFDDDMTRRIFVTMLTEGEEALDQDQELVADMLAAFSECPEALQGLGG